MNRCRAEWCVKSLQPRRLPEVPADTARAARAAFRGGNLAIRIRDELGEVWSDERYQSLFGVHGKPGISPAQLMIVLVLAVAENLTDRQAADMVLTDPIFSAVPAIAEGRFVTFTAQQTVAGAPVAPPTIPVLLDALAPVLNA